MATLPFAIDEVECSANSEVPSNKRHTGLSMMFLVWLQSFKKCGDSAIYVPNERIGV